MSKQLLSQIPAINKILLLDEVKSLIQEYSEVGVKSAIKNYIDEIKQEILNEELHEVPSLEKIVEEVTQIVKSEDKNSLRRVIHATGTILHTNLGRSLLSQKIKENIESVAFNYSNLEFDIDNKKRGSRYVHLIDIIKKLTGAEDVLVVNNNAAAVLLTLNTLVKDKEIVVSRGELVEIGGAFRIPEIIKLSGGTPVEVGTTNKTHLKDYENAITDNTGALLKVHTSNYKIVGFTKEVSNEEISYLARENELVSINDLGSGQFVDFSRFGLPYEPTVKEVLDSGIDIVTFSGDKLLGGPQAGIIVGKKEEEWQSDEREDLKQRLDKNSKYWNITKESVMNDTSLLEITKRLVANGNNFQNAFLGMEKKINFETSLEKISSTKLGGIFVEQIKDYLVQETEFKKEIYRFKNKSIQEHLEVEGLVDEELKLKRKVKEISFFKERKKILTEAYNLDFNFKNGEINFVNESEKGKKKVNKKISFEQDTTKINLEIEKNNIVPLDVKKKTKKKNMSIVKNNSEYLNTLKEIEMSI